MKKYRFYALTIFILLMFCTGLFYLKGLNNQIYNHASASAIYGSDGILSIPPHEGEKGTENNPFVILEIVPYEGFAEIGFLIGGCEPINPLDLEEGDKAFQILENMGTFDTVIMEEHKFDLEHKDVVGEKPGQWKLNTEETRIQFGYFEKVKDKKGDFLRRILETETINNPDGTESVSITKAEYYEDNKNGDYIWIPNPDSELIETNHNANKIGDKVHTSRLRNFYYREKSTLVNKNLFLKESLGVEEDKIDKYYKDLSGNDKPYNIKVITITPDELNKEANQPIIDRADLIYFSDSDHYNGELVKIWEQNHGKDSNHNKHLADNDLTWETTVALFKKASIGANRAPLVFDVSVYSDVSNGYGKNIKNNLDKKYSTGVSVSNHYFSEFGYCSNTRKLYLMMQQMEPGKFYNEYIKTGLIESVEFRDNNGHKPSDIPMTTGYYKEQSNTTAAIYWSPQTFLPYQLFKGPEEIDGGNAFNMVGIDNYKVLDGSNEANTSIRHNTYTYNKDKSMTMGYDNATIADNQYTKEAFDYFESLNGTRPTFISPGQAIYYLLNMNKPYYNKEVMRILEIEPCNDFIWTGSEEPWEIGNTGNSSLDYAKQYFTKFFPGFTGKVMITTMTSSEFIGKIEDLNTTYDMIFFGLKSGVMRKSNNRTIYNDDNLNGKVYLHNGDYIRPLPVLSGLTNKPISEREYYRFSGNDITLVILNKLKEFMSAGYPIVLDKGFYTNQMRDSVNEDLIDEYSNIYKLAEVASDYLFYADGINTNLLELSIAKGKCRINFGSLDEMTPITASYPIIYKDRTSPEYAELSEHEIYINGLNTSNRTLQYKFYITDNSDRNTSYQVKLYIDINADGKYDERTEDVGSLGILNDQGYSIRSDELKAGINYTVTRNLEEEYIGILPWKLEIISNQNANIRDSVINYSAIKATDKIDINVLQIMPNKNNTVDLSRTDNLFYQHSSNLSDYNLRFLTFTVNEFERKCGNRVFSNILKDDNDNSPYEGRTGTIIKHFDDDGDGLYDIDMLILGFGDMYSDIDNNNALKNIEDFIEEGKTVLFTHDTTSFVNQETIFSDMEILGFWGYHINQRFRSILGMDRFGVMPNSETTGKDTVKPGDPHIEGYTNITLNRFSLKNPLFVWKEQYASHKNFKLISLLDFFDWWDIFDDDINKSTDISTEYVTNVNDGQITMYPYKIAKNFKIAKTHGQYYQLNMENDDIVVWYSLSDDKSSKINPGIGKDNGVYSTTPNDVRNNYYIYNKGNITYSGVGHTSPNNAMEVKLFINTMIAAYTATAKAPQIEITNPNKSSDIYGKDYVYVDYDIYDTTKAYGSYVTDGSTQYQRVKYKVIDNNILFNKRLTVKYYEITLKQESDGTVTRIENEIMNGKTRKVRNNEEVNRLYSGEEYYFELLLTDLKVYNQGKDVSIKVFITYGKNSDKSMSQVKDFTLIRRGLFDLD